MSPINSATAAGQVILSGNDTLLDKEERPLQLPINKIVRAVVTEGGRNRVLLEIDQRQVLAETRIPLPAGRKLDLQVVAISPKIELKVVQDPLQNRLARTIHLLAAKWDILAFVRQLTEDSGHVFNRLSPASRETLLTWLPPPPDGAVALEKGEALLQQLQNLGLPTEANIAAEGKNTLASLKNALAEVIDTLSTHKEVELAERAGRLLQTLELSQLCQIRLAQQDVLFHPLPLPFLEQGHMVLEREKQPKAGDKTSPLKLTLHLSLQGLGDLTVELLFEPRGLFVRFTCESADKMRFVAGFQDELSRCLDFLPLEGLAFASGAHSPARSLLERILPDGDSVLDTRA